MVMLIISNLMVNRIKKKKDPSMLFFVAGMVTCFFDFLTTETLSLTVPLFIYIYLNRDKVRFKDLIKYVLLWLSSYALMFMCKWGLCAYYYGFDKIGEILGFASVRVSTEKMNIFTVVGPMFIQALSYIFPFNFTGYGLPITLCLILIGLYNYVFNISDKKKYLLLLLVGLIPIGRFLLLSSHSSFHIYFTYRALIPFIMFTLLVIIDGFCEKQDK